MNVKELKEQIANLPDDMEVVLQKMQKVTVIARFPVLILMLFIFQIVHGLETFFQWIGRLMMPV